MFFRQALWPTGNSAVAHFWAMAHRLKTSGLINLVFITIVGNVKLNAVCPNKQKLSIIEKQLFNRLSDKPHLE